uniref:Uncharacterized protein n=1 Tax=Rhinolophus ferrumequinum TaxID=59479 RepID=A0A671EB18_RHIFE
MPHNDDIQAGLTYIRDSQICAKAVRDAPKVEFKSNVGQPVSSVGRLAHRALKKVARSIPTWAT